MVRHAYAKLALPLVLSGVLALPAAGSASDGGAAATTTPPTSSGSASGGSGALTLRATRSTLVNRTITLAGSASRASAGRLVIVELHGHSRWTQAARARVTSRGTYSTRWRANPAGRVSLRARLSSSSAATRAKSASAALSISVYKPARATWYGPGFFGNRTACGQRLTSHTLGVAHRTLRCGTKVDIYYGGRTIRVPVIDRGPYANHADWDLTSATADRLHFHSTGNIGVIVLR
jgi:rare lipoprotein A (peptidoglycan hydrolase)